MSKEGILAIHYRHQLRRKLVAFWGSLDRDTQENRKIQKLWGQILEQVLYKPRRNDNSKHSNTRRR